jgi:Uma2 family endonuclease
MATTPRASTKRDVEYPTSDGKPMAEADVHRQIMIDLIDILMDRYASDPNVYVSGDLLLFYEEGNKRRHVAPDVFVVLGVPKLPLRDYYLLWKEGKSPDVVIEVTSKTTRKEDQNKKRGLYQDVLKVQEYFMFDPFEDYLRPSFQGFGLKNDIYVPIEPISGRLTSEVMSVEFERAGEQIHVFDTVTGERLLTPRERAALAEARAVESEAENRRLRQELEALRRQQSDRS